MKAVRITFAPPVRPFTLLGFGLVAGVVVGSMAGNSAQAYQATFNLKSTNAAGTSRTFSFGGDTDLYTEMTVQSFAKNGNDSTSTLGTQRDVTTNSSDGLCVISPNCAAGQETAAIQLSFSKPIQNFSFKVGLNVAPGSGWSGTNFTSYLRFNVAGSSPIDLALSDLSADSSVYSFTPSVLVAAGTAIKVGLYCDGSACPNNFTGTTANFYISDVIVEAPAPLPLIGTGAAFAWTRRLRRRIKATPGTSSQV